MCFYWISIFRFACGGHGNHFPENKHKHSPTHTNTITPTHPHLHIPSQTPSHPHKHTHKHTHTHTQTNLSGFWCIGYWCTIVYGTSVYIFIFESLLLYIILLSYREQTGWSDFFRPHEAKICRIFHFWRRHLRFLAWYIIKSTRFQHKKDKKPQTY